jgi:hypothetical protein
VNSWDRVAAVVSEPWAVSFADQTRQPQDVFTGGEALPRAIASRHEWLWLIGPGMKPNRDALERLIQGTEPNGDPPGSLVAGMVLDRAGAPVADHLPAPRYADEAAVIRLVPQHLLPIRHSPFANCLIDRSCFDLHGLPEFRAFGPFAATAWTASVLQTQAGYFAPRSIVRLSTEVAGPDRRDLLTMTRYAMRVARSGAWTRGESMRAFTRIAVKVIDPDRG